MEIQDIFLVFGEKCQELEQAGHTPFFQYYGHVRYFEFKVYSGKWHSGKLPAIYLNSSNFPDVATFLQLCLNASNLLMLDPTYSNQ